MMKSKRAGLRIMFIGCLTIMCLILVLSGCIEASVPEIDEASVQEIYEPIVTRTPVPTMAPGPVEELLLGIAESSEIAEGTFLGLSVEEWISIVNSALFVLVGLQVVDLNRRWRGHSSSLAASAAGNG